MKTLSRRSLLSLCVLGATFTLGACGGGDDGGSSSPQAPAASTGTPDADAAADVPASFTVDSRLKLNALGGVFLEAFPVALFQDGRALSDTTGLLYADGLAAHRTRFPTLWSQWRQNGSDLQVQQADGSWKTLNGTLPLAGNGVRRAGIYQALSVAFSPSISVIASDQYTLTDVGAIGRGSYVVGSSANVGAIATTPDKRGTYTIDGYRLKITFENGAKEEHVIVVDTRPQYLFIDGVMYSSN
jgi:hypothetical protein